MELRYSNRLDQWYVFYDDGHQVPISHDRAEALMEQGVPEGYDLD